VPVPRPATSDVGRLIEELKSSDALRRETAIARLAVIGARAVTPLMTVAADETAPHPSRVAALDALQAMGGGRAANLALGLSNDPESSIAVAAVGVLGPIARGNDGRATRALEHLASLALEQGAPTVKRLAALDALEGLPGHLLQPVWAALTTDTDSRIVARVTRKRAGVTMPLDELVSGALPDNPDVVSAVVREDAEKTSVTVLRTLVDQIRAREKLAHAEDRARWAAVRGQVHQGLAARGSRLALYDLKETLEEAEEPLPVGFLAAIASVGDVSCLEPLATAWITAHADNHWWRDHLSDAFRAIVKRENLTRRHPAMKRILAKLPAAGVLVALARRA
jgi:hypothetical protein